ncbi:MAG: hypothetical protein ACJARK_001565, partial [Marinobacter psychrophilus]
FSNGTAKTGIWSPDLEVKSLRFFCPALKALKGMPLMPAMGWTCVLP